MRANEGAPSVHWTDYLVATAVRLRATMVVPAWRTPLSVPFRFRDNIFHETEQMCVFLAASGVPTRLHLRITEGLTALTIGATFIDENSANHADDEHFERLLRTYLDSIVWEMAESAG